MCIKREKIYKKNKNKKQTIIDIKGTDTVYYFFFFPKYTLDNWYSFVTGKH